MNEQTTVEEMASEKLKSGKDNGRKWKVRHYNPHSKWVDYIHHLLVANAFCTEPKITIEN